MANIQIEVRNADSEKTWTEDYNCSDPDPQAWAKRLIDNFNATLKMHEKPRVLVGVRVLDEEVILTHAWRKVNAVTIVRGTSSYDKMECEICGVTGKRFGLTDRITRDTKYKAKKYDVCKVRK